MQDFCSGVRNLLLILRNKKSKKKYEKDATVLAKL